MRLLALNRWLGPNLKGHELLRDGTKLWTDEAETSDGGLAASSESVASAKLRYAAHANFKKQQSAGKVAIQVAGTAIEVDCAHASSPFWEEAHKSMEHTQRS